MRHPRRPVRAGELSELSGIGKETARAFAGRGAITVLVGRNREKTAAVVHQIQTETGNPQVSADSPEMTLALNHLAPFLLTHLLSDALYASPAGRVINISSEAHRAYHLNFEKLQLEQGYSAWKAYGQSKLANIYFTYALAASFDGAAVTVNGLHPGFASTNFGRSNGGLLDPMHRLAHLAAISPKVSAQAILYLACAPELQGVNAGYFNLTRQARSSEISYDMNIAKQLWDASLELTGLAQPMLSKDGRPAQASRSYR